MRTKDQKNKPLRFESLEDRMMLSVNVGIGDSTVFVTGGGEDDYVTVRQVDHHLFVKEHDSLVEKIDLRQFHQGWNLHVDLDGGNDHLRLDGLHGHLKRVNVDTGGQLGIDTGLNHSDNDSVELRNVHAAQIVIETGASINGQPNPEFAFGSDGNSIGIAYYDNDRVHLHDTSTHGEDLHIRTGTEVHLGFNMNHDDIGVASLVENGDSPFLQDNDKVYVSGFESNHGNLWVETGTHIEANVWHDVHDDPAAAAAVDGGDPSNGYTSDAVSLEDRDHVLLKHVQIHGGKVHVETGLHAEIDVAGEDDLAVVDAALEGFDTPTHDIAAHIDDRDIVELHRVRVKAAANGDANGTVETETIPNEGKTGVKIHTATNIYNNDPWSYLALQLWDDDAVKLKSVHTDGSILIWTGMNQVGRIGNGDPNGSGGQSDKDHVELKGVRQLNPGAVTEVLLGDDDDHLHIFYSKFHGLAFFDGGEGHNKKKVERTHFAQPPVFVNFGNDVV